MSRVLGFLSKHRPTLTPLQLNILVCLFMLALHNKTFFSRAQKLLDATMPLFVLAIGAFGLTLSIITIFTPFGAPIFQKISLLIITAVSATSSFFTDTFGSTYNDEMIENIFESNLGEASQVVSMNEIISILTWSLPLMFLIVTSRIAKRKIQWEVIIWILTLAFGLVLFSGAKSLQYRAFTAVSRHEMNSVAYALQPGAILVAAVTYAKSRMQITGKPFIEIAPDAIEGPYRRKEVKPTVVVLVIGETARASNFGFNGYNRETTPQIDKENIINFGHTASCATSTLASLRCIFSSQPAKDLTFEKFSTTENLLDVAKRAGFDVRWFDNDFTHSGGGVAERITVNKSYENSGQHLCPYGDCRDSILLSQITDIAPSIKQDTLVILHMVGSHFPYYRRYPEDFRFFKPTCDTEILADCSMEEILNAYDNSIRYTDHIVASVIRVLESNKNITSTLIYTSDHGESLGENGVFLHSAPMEAAPKEQYEVPLILWMSDRYQNSFNVNRPCLEKRQWTGITHEYFFHTTLSLMDIETTTLNSDLDLLSKCRNIE